ncbi:hypothetical protein P775_11260 [Puniceibacterium antarcticum]|uniref:Uncharacterized protein n=1 Tax=Puniceibacterium antarcticum TaxID=1206336 RepID=A0A2G8REY7_9RHOB|nr:hypothetical protein P775_11260 [Puniceibacterium antarcticum]
MANRLPQMFSMGLSFGAYGGSGGMLSGGYDDVTAPDSIDVPRWVC